MITSAATVPHICEHTPTQTTDALVVMGHCETGLSIDLEKERVRLGLDYDLRKKKMFVYKT